MSNKKFIVIVRTMGVEVKHEFNTRSQKEKFIKTISFVYGRNIEIIEKE
jgi:hypothetical protein